MHAPGLRLLFRRELLVAPKTAFCIAGCPGLQGALADDLREKMKLTAFVPALTDIDALLEPARPSALGPLAAADASAQAAAKSYLRCDFFSHYQQSRPAVVLALVEMAALTSGASQWRQTQDAIVDVHEKCKARGMRMVVAVVGPAPDTAAVLGEFEAAVTHKTLLEPRFILRLATAPTQPEKDALVAAIKSQADRAYEAWQSAAYRRTQALAAQPGAPPAKDFVRYTLKGAHFLELMQKWQGARTKYNEGYRQLQRAMPAARAAADVLDLRPLLMAADWVHLKLLLYAIGSGQVTREHMAALAALWASHLLVFAAPIEGAHAALRAWHAEWVVRQHHVMLAVLQMYCAAVPQSDFPTELRGYMLLEGAAAAALRRQSLQAQVAAADFGVVLDTATVAEGLWLGRWIKQDADVARHLTASEALSYIAHQEQSADHCTILANVYQDCIALLPPLPKPADATAAADGGGAAAAAAEPKADTHRRHYLALIAQRAWQIVQRAVTRGAADGSLDEAWGMLSRAAVSFRRDGCFSLLARALDAMASCATLRQTPRALLIARLELAVIDPRGSAAERTEAAHAALGEHLQPRVDSPHERSGSSSGSAPSGSLRFDVRGAPQMRRPDTQPPAPPPPDLFCRGWLNVVHVAASCTHSGRASGDVIVAVALRNLLPEADGAAAPTLPLTGLRVTMESDLGFMTTYAAPTALRRPSVAGAARGSVDGAALRPGSRHGSLRSSRQLAHQSDDRGSAAELDAMPQRRAEWAADAPPPPAAAPLDDAALWPGEWAVFALRLFPGAAKRVALHAVTLELAGGCEVTYHVAELAAEKPGQRVVSGTPALDVSSGMVGRDAPFGRLATALDLGRLALSLVEDALPPVRVVLSEPVGLLHVGDAVCITATVTSQGASSAQRALMVRASAPEERVALLAGEDLAAAAPVPPGGVQLPILAKGVAHTVHVWLVGKGACEGDVEVSIAGSAAGAVQRRHFEVLEPLVVHASVVPAGARATLLRRPPAAAVLGSVPAGEPCVLRVLVTSVVPYAVALERVTLQHLPEGWALTSSSCGDAASEAHVLRKNDVYAATFQLSAAAALGVVTLGALQLDCCRRDEASAAGTRGEADGAARMRRFTLEHTLHGVAACEVAAVARLEAPQHAPVDTPVPVRLHFTADRARVQAGGRASVGVTGGASIQGDEAQNLTGDESNLTWQMACGQHAFVDVACRVELSTAEAAAGDAGAGEAGGSPEALGAGAGGSSHVLRLGSSMVVSGAQSVPV